MRASRIVALLGALAGAVLAGGLLREEPLEPSPRHASRSYVVGPTSGLSSRTSTAAPGSTRASEDAPARTTDNPAAARYVPEPGARKEAPSAASGTLDDAIAPAEERRLTVVVRGTPAAILVRGASTSDERNGTRGEFRLLQGAYSVVVAAPGMGTAVREVALLDDATLEVSLEREALIEGRVVDLEGRPVRGVSVRASLDDGPPLAAAWTGEDGRYVLAGLEAREHVLAFVAPEAFLDARLARTAPASVDVTLEPAARLRVAWTSELDDDRFTVLVDEPGPRAVFAVSRERKGAATFGKLAPGAHRVEVSSPRGRAVATVTLGSSKEETVSLVVARGRVVEGQVVDEDGVPAEAEISWSNGQARTDALGRFSLANVPEGELVLSGRGLSGTGSVVVRAGETSASLVVR